MNVLKSHTIRNIGIVLAKAFNLNPDKAVESVQIAYDVYLNEKERDAFISGIVYGIKAI